jgi:hypothetical protein
MSQTILSLPLAQAPATWLTAWLTPIWFLAVGIAMGLLLLGAFLVLFRGLSLIPFWERLSASPAGHAVAAILTVIIAGTIWAVLPEEAIGLSQRNEPLLLGIALVLLCSIVGWSLVFCSSKRIASSSLRVLSEGAAGYLGLVALIIVALGGALWALNAVSPSPIVAEPVKAFASIPQVFSTGKQTVTRTIPGSGTSQQSPFVPVDLAITGIVDQVDTVDGRGPTATWHREGR